MFCHRLLFNFAEKILRVSYFVGEETSRSQWYFYRPSVLSNQWLWWPHPTGLISAQHGSINFTGTEMWCCEREIMEAQPWHWPVVSQILFHFLGPARGSWDGLLESHLHCCRAGPPTPTLCCHVMVRCDHVVGRSAFTLTKCTCLFERKVFFDKTSHVWSQMCFARTKYRVLCN